MFPSQLIFTAYLLATGKALTIVSAGTKYSENKGLFSISHSENGILKKNLHQLQGGAKEHKRKQQQYQTYERLEQLVDIDPDTSSEYSPKVFPKEENETRFIKEVLKANLMFQDLFSKKGEKNHGLSNIVASFEKQIFDEGTLLCEQGDTANTDYLYLIASGSCSVSIDGKILPDPYGTIGLGSLIGELALLYGTARAATVRTKTAVSVYRLERRDFHHFMNCNPADSDKTQTDSSPYTNSRAEKVKRDLREIDGIIDRFSGVKTKYDGDIIQKFKPSRMWLWSKWRGTIMQHAWRGVVGNMVISLLFMMALRFLNYNVFKSPVTWPIGGIPHKNHPTITRLEGCFKMWSYTVSVTTILLSFYLNKAYDLWRNVYGKGRKLQGCMNDICMILACSAERNSRTGEYTSQAKALLDDVSVYCRLCHAFSWAGLVNRFNVLLTKRGLSRMLSRGLITRSQYDTLIGLDRNKCGPQHTTIMWILSRIERGIRDGLIDPGLRIILTNKVCEMRGTIGTIESSLAGNIPLAYVQFVQILVDMVLFIAPFALYSELGIWSVFAVGVLNIFFSGINDLAKILLDPLDNCDKSFYKDSSVNMDVGVLIRESNADSNRWKSGVEKLPFDLNS